jgi:uncharacterized protein (TIGR02246 family)
MKPVLVVAAAVFVLTGAAPTPAQETAKALQDNFLGALIANDADAVAKCYAKDAVFFPVAGELVLEGSDAIRASWAGFFSANRVTACALSQTSGSEMGDTSVAWGLWQMTFQPLAGGEPVTMDGRFMDMAKKIDGKWRYVADHPSVPLLPPPPPAKEAAAAK